MELSGRDWTPDPVLVETIEQLSRRAVLAYEQDRHLVGEHYGHEEQIRVGGYSSRTLLELVQNAADAMVSSGTREKGLEEARVEIVLDPEAGILYCANTGAPFDSAGLTAICHAYLSDKKGDEIGRFGLGFKSVLAVTDRPQVLSRSIAFEFNAESARCEIERVVGDHDRLPILRTPTVLNALRTMQEDPTLRALAKWATTIIRLPHLKKLEQLTEEMRNFRSEFLLFVSSVRKIRLRVLGAEGFDIAHTSEDVGNGILRIKGPDGDPNDWLVGQRMYEPTLDARKQAGESASRERIKISVAIPKKRANRRLGEFWSYFPLQDQTTATGLFNAPWSVNDDRTTLLKNKYNLEIAKALSEEFANLIPKLSNNSDPAVHFDYLPARGREIRGYGDQILSEWVPRFCAQLQVIPDATGALKWSSDLRPLRFQDYGEYGLDVEAIRNWQLSPNTGTDVPDWHCYANAQRIARMRELFAFFSGGADLVDGKRDLENVPDQKLTRSINQWLVEWASGPDMNSTAQSILFAFRHRSDTRPALEQARIVPTTRGKCSFSACQSVYLPSSNEPGTTDHVFVDATVFRIGGIRECLSRVGFRQRDGITVLRECLHALVDSNEFSGTEQKMFWNAARAVRVLEAQTLLDREKRYLKWIRVPTVSGLWQRAFEVVDLNFSVSSHSYADRALDRDHCVPEIARWLGVVTGPDPEFAYRHEWAADRYEESIGTDVDRRSSGSYDSGPLELKIEGPERGRGPFSLLKDLEEWGVGDARIEGWTRTLLENPANSWYAVDRKSQERYRVEAPQIWAARCYGRFNTSLGFRRKDDVVSTSLAEFGDLIPVFKGPETLEPLMRFPREICEVPTRLLREALENIDLNPGCDMAQLVKFILQVFEIGHGGQPPRRIPARVLRVFESTPTENVFVATSIEEEDYLQKNERPYLRATSEDAERLFNEVGCARFSDSFAFSASFEGEDEPELLLDAFTGLKHEGLGRRLSGIKLIRCESIEKRVSTPDGVIVELKQCLLEDLDLYVCSVLTEKEVLVCASRELGLDLRMSDIKAVLEASLDDRLELQRQKARAARTDAERLAVYVSDDDLLGELPTGLWSVLESQGLAGTLSVPELFFRVNGSDSLKILKEVFLKKGFSDVPEQWVGAKPTIEWVQKMGFRPEYAGQKQRKRPAEITVPGAVHLPPLHEYQKVLKDRLTACLAELSPEGHHWKGMLVLPTGAGKTRVAVETALTCLISGELEGTILWIAQSDELCEQAVGTFDNVWRGLKDPRPLSIARLWASNEVESPDTEFSVVVATDAKLHSIIEGSDSDRYEWVRESCAVFVDEAHTAGDSPRYTKILQWLGVDGRSWSRPLVGLTATPFKGRSRDSTEALANRFGKHRLDAFEGVGDVYGELVDQGVLARVVHRSLGGARVELSADERTNALSLGRVDGTVLDRVGSDFQRMRILVNDIMQLSEAESRSVLVFTPSVFSSDLLAALLNCASISASAVSGKSSWRRRREVVEQFRSGEIRVLANCNVLTQGFDAPKVTALYVARPTFSPNAYIQMAGRGLRGPQNGGKKECLIVDMNDDFVDDEINDLMGSRFYLDLWNRQA